MTDPLRAAPATSSQDNTASPRHEDGSVLRRYERPHEEPAPVTPLHGGEAVPFRELDRLLGGSTLSEGGQALLRGLLRLGRTAIFPGGGAGIEYGGLLKTAARPDDVGAHVREAAAYLHERQVDLLVVPGMSGYPIGSMYAIVSGIPAMLLKKQRHAASSGPGNAPESGTIHYPPGSFVIPSYTGDGDVVMSADLDALRDIIEGILLRQVAAQRGEPVLSLSVRVAGADDIIDKATMSQAVSESALIVVRAAIARFVARHRERSGDAREIAEDVTVAGWVTPLIKGYNRPHEHLHRWFGIVPFAGLNVTSVHLDPPAIGIEGVGIVGFADNEEITALEDRPARSDSLP